MADVTPIPLDRIVANLSYQPRLDGLDDTHLRSLLESEPEDWPPLVVSPDGQKYTIVDGFHRHEAAKRLGLAALPCIVVPDAGYPEAFAANLAHGLPLSIADRKAFARWLHKEEPGLSFREIGRRCGLSDKTVAATVRTAARHAESPRQAVSRPAPDPIEKLVDLILMAQDSGVGTGFFGGDTSARHVRRIIEAYEEEYRHDVAVALTRWGHACIDAAKPYVMK